MEPIKNKRNQVQPSEIKWNQVQQSATKSSQVQLSETKCTNVQKDKPSATKGIKWKQVMSHYAWSIFVTSYCRRSNKVLFLFKA